MKYRIKKYVRYDTDCGDKEPHVRYFIQWKCLWWWENMESILGSKYLFFDSVEEAESALEKHIKFLTEIESDGKVMKTIKG